MKLAPGFKRVVPQRPMVVRKGDVVKVCYFYQGMKECLGTACYWQKIGRCPIFERLKRKAK